MDMDSIDQPSRARKSAQHLCPDLRVEQDYFQEYFLVPTDRPSNFPLINTGASAYDVRRPRRISAWARFRCFEQQTKLAADTPAMQRNYLGRTTRRPSDNFSAHRASGFQSRVSARSDCSLNYWRVGSNWVRTEFVTTVPHPIGSWWERSDKERK